MVPVPAAGYGLAIVPVTRSFVRRLAQAALLGLVAVALAASAWFGWLAPTRPLGGPIAAAPSPAGPAGAGGSAAPAATPAALAATPSPTPSVSEPPVAAPPTGNFATQQALSLRLDTLRTTYGLPGVSAAILFADGSSWQGTAGLANVAAARPVTPDTEFALASISKTFLSALVMLFAEEARLDLETPVTSYLPDLAIDPSITVRQLLDHTSGLRDYFFNPAIDKALLAHPRRVWTAADALRYVGKPYFKSGRGWHYSNTNYVVLGLLAEKVGGAPLARQLAARFLSPLGLDHTYYQGADDPTGPLARGYRFSGPGLDLPPIPLSDGTRIVPFTSVVTAAGSAGSIASTALDLAIWAKALYGGRVLAPASLAAMLADAARTAPFKPSIPYGLGVQLITIDGRPTLGHSGRLVGSRSVVRWLPDQGIAIAVLTNQSRSDPALVARALLRVVLGDPPGCTSCAKTD